MTGKQKGEELPNTHSSHITLPWRKRRTARGRWLWETEQLSDISAKLSWSAHGANRLAQRQSKLTDWRLFTPHRLFQGMSRDVSYGNHYRANHWALSSLHKWTELDWVSRGSPFNMSKECGPPASSPQTMPKLSPLRSEWSRFALCLPNDSLTKSFNIGKEKYIEIFQPILERKLNNKKDRLTAREQVVLDSWYHTLPQWEVWLLYIWQVVADNVVETQACPSTGTWQMTQDMWQEENTFLW